MARSRRRKGRWEFSTLFVDRRPKRDPVSFGQATDPTRFSSANYRIFGTAWDPVRDGLSSISPVAYRHNEGGPALDADSHPGGASSTWRTCLESTVTENLQAGFLTDRVRSGVLIPASLMPARRRSSEGLQAALHHRVLKG